MKSTIILLVALLFVGFAFAGAAPTPIAFCQNINVSNTQYQLTNNLNGTNATSITFATDTYSACLFINASNVSINCLGAAYYNITGNSSSGNPIGILIGNDSVTPTNVTIENCPIRNYTIGIAGYFSNDTIYNNTLYNNTQSTTPPGIPNEMGIFGYYAVSNNIFNLNTINLSGYGIRVISSSGSDDNYTSNTILSTVQTGIDLNGPDSSDLVYNNTLINTSSSNSYQSLTLYTVTLSNISLNNISSGFGSSAMGLQQSSNNNLTSNTVYNNSGDGIYLDPFSTNNTLVGNTAYNNSINGFNISGNYTTLISNTANQSLFYGFVINSSNNILTQNTAYNNSFSGFYVVGGNSSTLTLNYATLSHTNGFSIAGYNNTLSQNYAYNNSASGFDALGNSDNFSLNNATLNGIDGFVVASANDVNNTLTQDYAYENNYSGFSLNGNSSFVSYDNATQNTRAGFYVSAPINTLIQTNAVDNSGDAFTVLGNSTVIDNSTAYGSPIGVYVLNVTNTSLNNDLYYNDSVGLDFNTSSGHILNLSSVTFADNTDSNLFVLSLNDSAPSAVEYQITYEAPASPPSGYSSFDNKGVNITTVSGSMSLDNLTFSWTPSESSGYDTSAFDLEAYGGVTWFNPGLIPNAYSFNVSNFGGFPSAIVAILYPTPSSPPSSGGSGRSTLPSLTSTFTPSCVDNSVQVTSDGSPVTNANVMVEDASSYVTLYSGTTDSNGNFNFTGCGGDVIIQSTDSGYSSYSASGELVSCGICNPMTNTTTPVVTPTVTPAVTPTTPAMSGTTDNTSMPSTTMENTSMPEMTNTTMQNTSMPATTMPAASPSMTLASSGDVGDQLSGSVSNCPSCTVQVTDPNGVVSTITPGSDGSFTLPLSVAGSYTVSLVSAGTPVQSESVTSVSPAPPGNNNLLIIGVIVLIIIIAGAYFMTRKKTA